MVDFIRIIIRIFWWVLLVYYIFKNAKLKSMVKERDISLYNLTFDKNKLLSKYIKIKKDKKHTDNLYMASMKSYNELNKEVFKEREKNIDLLIKVEKFEEANKKLSKDYGFLFNKFMSLDMKYCDNLNEDSKLEKEKDKLMWNIKLRDDFIYYIGQYENFVSYIRGDEFDK